MRLRNTKTGEIVEFHYLQSDYISPLALTIMRNGKPVMIKYNSIAELNAEWEDVLEEPFSTSFYTIVGGKIKHCIFYRERVAGCPDDAWAYIKDDGRECIKQLKEVGLYFETEEEAEEAVEKLKIYNKLKQKGFVFSGWYYSTEGQLVILADNHEFSETEPEDLTELFGDKIC